MERSTFTICEEFRIMDKGRLDSIVKPFAYARQTPYLKMDKYKNIPVLIEEPKEIMISSAYYKSEWWFQSTADTIRMMMKGFSAGFIAFDYLIALKHNIKTKKLILKEKETMDSITFQQEYLNLPFGENADAFFKLDMFKKTQNIKKAFYPQRNDSYNSKTNIFNIKKTSGEIRVISVDIATRKGKENDNTVICCTRLLPTNNGYDREVSYMETFNGENTILQAKRIKQVFYDFESDYLVLDLQQNGITVFDLLGKVVKDEERGIEYPAWTVIEGREVDEKVYKELSERTISLNAIPLIYPVQASAKSNNDSAFSLRNKLQSGMINFLISENDADDYLLKNNKEYRNNSDDVYLKLWYLHPYIQIAETINEMVSLSMKLNNGLVKLEEPSSGRKDRYTAISYMNMFVDILDKDIIKEEDENGWLDFVKTTSAVKQNNNNYFKFI